MSVLWPLGQFIETSLLAFEEVYSNNGTCADEERGSKRRCCRSGSETILPPLCFIGRFDEKRSEFVRGIAISGSNLMIGLLVWNLIILYG